MSLTLYNDVLNLALDQVNVDLLVKIWSDSFKLNVESMMEINKKIVSFLPSLRKRIGMPPSESKDFKKFVKDYDEFEYKSQCSEHPTLCTIFFAKRGNLRYLKKALAKKATLYPKVVRVAAKHNHRNILAYIFELVGDQASYLSQALEGATEGGHLDLVEYFLEKGAERSEDSFYYAAKNGSPEILKFFDFQTVEQKRVRLEGASSGGHLDLVKLILREDRKVVSIENGLLAAANRGHLEVVSLFVEYGAKNLLLPIREAAKKGHLPVVKYLLTKNDTLGSLAVEFSLRYKHLEVTKFLVENKFVEFYKVIRDSAQGDYLEEFSYLVSVLLKLEKEYVRETLVKVIDIVVRRGSKDFLACILSAFHPSTLIQELETVLDYVLLTEASHSKLELLKESLKLEGRTVSYETLVSKSQRLDVIRFLAENVEDLNLALLKAVNDKNENAISVLINVGATNLEEALSLALQIGDRYIIRRLHCELDYPPSEWLYIPDDDISDDESE